jgi:hypothetical protein
MATALFVCLHNAGRSQMSAALFERAAGGRHHALSAGTTPAERVHPEVVAVMREPGDEGAGVAAAHRDHQVRPLGEPAGEQLRPAVGQVDVEPGEARATARCPGRCDGKRSASRGPGTADVGDGPAAAGIDSPTSDFLRTKLRMAA